MFFIITGVLFSAVVIGRLIDKYYKYETFTDVRRVITDKNTFPSLSVCEFNSLQSQFFTYCGKRMSLQANTTRNTECGKIKTKSKKEKSVGNKTGNWMNEKFEVSSCKSWGKIEDCNSDLYLKSRMNGACFTWNHAGNFYDTYYGHLELSFKYLQKNKDPKQPPPVIVIIPHDPEITEVDLTKKVTLDAHKKYEITIAKTHLLRKPHPYSKCMSQAGSSELDVFPGAYSRRTCMETYKMMEAYKKCGDIFDYFKSFLPESIKRQYHQNKTVGDVTNCIARNINVDPPKDLCPFPCKELSLTFSTSTNDKVTSLDPWSYQIEMQLDNVDSYTILEEQPLYSAEQMSAEIGGFLGLVVGASLLSVIELLACGSLFLLRKFYNMGGQ